MTTFLLQILLYSEYAFDDAFQNFFDINMPLESIQTQLRAFLSCNLLWITGIVIAIVADRYSIIIFWNAKACQVGCRLYWHMV